MKTSLKIFLILVAAVAALMLTSPKSVSAQDYSETVQPTGDPQPDPTLVFPPQPTPTITCLPSPA